MVYMYVYAVIVFLIVLLMTTSGWLDYNISLFLFLTWNMITCVIGNYGEGNRSRVGIYFVCVPLVYSYFVRAQEENVSSQKIFWN